MDRAAERFADTHGRDVDPEAKARAVLAERGIDVTLSDSEEIRAVEGKRITLSTRAAPETRRFQLLHQLALTTQNELLEATLDLARFQSDAARAIAKIGLANYYAGAALLPYRAFLEAAEETRHDLERLADRFGASIEQVAHRLSTMQRPGLKGIPFFFCPRRSGRHDHQAPFRDTAAVRPLRRGLPLVERAPRLRDTRAASCGNWPRRPTECAIFALRAMSPSRAGRSTRRCGVTPSGLAAR